MKKGLFVLMVVVMIIGSTGCGAIQKASSASDSPNNADAPATDAGVTLENPVLNQQISETPTEMVDSTNMVIPTEVPTITHVSIPAEPVYSPGQKVTDCNTGQRVALGVTTLVAEGCDNWQIDKLERPVDYLNGTYFPWLDIVSVSMGTNQAWMFANIQLFKDAAGKLPQDLVVGVELDLNLDSRGDFLVLVKGINSKEWTTNGVQVWKDINGDVGGEKSHTPDDQKGNGYETLVFDSGKGDDVDLAWARIDPTNGAVIEFAFKPSLLPKNQVFAWWAWVGQGEVDPQQMEMIDYKSEASVWKMDNTCGWIYNAKPSRMLSNICDFVVPTVTPLPSPTPKPGFVCKLNSEKCRAKGPGWEFDAATCTCILWN